MLGSIVDIQSSTAENRRGKRRQAGVFLRPDYAASSERPQFRMLAVRNAPELRSQHDAAPPVQLQITISRRASCCCSNAIAEIDIGKNFKMYLLRQFCSNRVEFCTINLHRRHRRKKMMDQNFEIPILWFLIFFWNFQKGAARSLYGRSITMVGLYGPIWSRPN